MSGNRLATFVLGALLGAAIVFVAGWWWLAPMGPAGPGTWGAAPGWGPNRTWGWPGGMGAGHAQMMAWHMGSGYASGTDQLPAPPPPGGARVEATVVLDEWSVTPAALTARQGEVLVLTVRNEGTVVHGFAIPGLGVEIAAIPPGGSRTIELGLSAAGEYAYYCPVPGHAQLGQQGTLTVTKP